jgi:hypothetical protein
MTGPRGDVGNHEPNQDGSALENFLVEELSASVLELPDCRLAQGATAAAGEVEAPLMRLGVVETQAQGFNVPRRAPLNS